MIDERKVQRGLLLAEIEEAEVELSRLSEKAARLANTIHEVANVVEDVRPLKTAYQHEEAQARARRSDNVRNQSKYRDAMNFEAMMTLIAEIETAKRKLAELQSRKSDADFHQLRAV